MTRLICAVASAVAISGASLLSQAQAPAPSSKGTEILTTQGKADAKNLIEDVKTVGCVRLWQPTAGDPTKMPADRQPGLAGIYLLTPLAASSLTDAGLPTYLLTPSATVNFSQHAGRRVEVTGTAQTAPLPPTVQEIATEPTQRPENKSTTNGMPRLTVTTMKVVGESCP